MSSSFIEENTLGVITGRNSKNLNRTPTRSFRNLGTAVIPGTGYLGIGIAVICIVQIFYGLARFLTNWTVYPEPWLSVIAWVLLLASLGGMAIIVQVNGGILPNLVFYSVLVVFAIVFVLDVVAVWSLGNVGLYATAAVALGAGLLAMVTLRGTVELIVSVGVLGAAMVAVMVISFKGTPVEWAAQVSALALTVLPGLIGALIVRSYRRMLQVELDRQLIQSNVSGPRFAVGMLASEQLARLDLAAEQLLDGVASGKIRLPLKPEIASTAASLATELRLHLLEGRRETWLYHAVTESEFLGRVVNVIDSNSVAGLLDPSQRDGLLSALWLLSSSSSKPDLTIEVMIGPVAVGHAQGGKLNIPIVITTTGVRRNRIDPSTWEALGKVGRFVDTVRGHSIRVEIESFVENPADR